MSCDSKVLVTMKDSNETIFINDVWGEVCDAIKIQLGAVNKKNILDQPYLAQDIPLSFSASSTYGSYQFNIPATKDTEKELRNLFVFQSIRGNEHERLFSNPSCISFSLGLWGRYKDIMLAIANRLSENDNLLVYYCEDDSMGDYVKFES